MPVISVLGTKGGVGKSTVSMGIAIWSSKILHKDWILLIDGDIHVRTVELKMCPVTDVTLSDVLEGKHPVEKAIYLCQLESSTGPLYPRLAILPAGGRFLPSMRGDPIEFINYMKKQFDRMIQKLRQRFKYIIVDTPASMSFEHLILTTIADGIIHVVEPNEDSIGSTLQTARGLKDLLDIDSLGVVINRMPKYASEDKWIERASKIATVLGVVPDDETVGKAFSKDLPVVAADPTCPASVALEKITSKLSNMLLKPSKPLSEKLHIAIQKTSSGTTLRKKES